VSPAGGIALARAAGGARADLRIARPPVNVLDAESLHALARQVRAAGDARLLVLTGLAAAFSAGVDVAEHAPEPAAIDTMLAAMRDALEALVASPAVTLAAAAGACLGGGAEILAACDLVLLTDDARVGFPEIRLACFPPGAAVLLPGLVGQARATDWILSGRILSGKEAADAGFAARSVPAARLDAETEGLAGRILAASPRALAAARDLLRERRREALARGLAAAEDAYRGLAGSEDLARAVRDFGARRR
jgi:cyclohexa-1,5-dienecarbonyl-CoA hydratase